MFGFKAGASSAPKEQRQDQRPAVAGKGGQGRSVQAPEPSVLGTGGAARAGQALRDRHARMAAAGNYADGGQVRGAAHGKTGSGTVGQAPLKDYATGGATRRRMEAAGLADGGRVQGPGTGISDDVPDQVREGTYILPADTTAQMDNLVDVNLSNGEHKLPPEQVQQIGAMVLDVVKNATHTPAAAQARGFQPGKQSAADDPELFFADGGLVDDAARRRAGTIFVDGAGNASQSLPSRAVVPYSAQQAAGSVTGSGPNPGTMYANSQGAVGRGFMPSSRELVPNGPGASAGPSQAAGSFSADEIQRARDTVTQRAKADSAKWQAERAAGPQPTPAAPAAPAAQGGRMGAVRSVINSPGKAGVLAAVPAMVAATNGDSTRRYAERFGMNEPTGDGSLGDIAKFTALRGLGFASDLGDTLTGGVAGKLAFRDVQPEPEAATAGGKVGRAVDNAIGTAMPFVNTFGMGERLGNMLSGGQQAKLQQPAAQPSQASTQGQPATQTPTTSAAPAPQGGAQGQDLPNNVIRDGNSYYATGPIREGFTMNGQPFVGSGVSNVPSEQNQQAVQNLLARTQAFGQGQQPVAAGFQPGGPVVAGIGGGDDRLRRQIINAASTAHRGAQNGQLTANQLRTLAGLQESDDRNATQLAATGANNAARLAEATMQEQGVNQRFGVSSALDAARVGSELEARGFTNRAAQRQEALYQAYEKAKTPDERSAIAQQIRDLAGKDTPNRYTVVPGGQEIDPTTQMLVTRPAMVLNNQTGEFMSPYGGQAQQAEQPLPNHVEALKNNPSLAAQFDARYGKGASARILGGN